MTNGKMRSVLVCFAWVMSLGQILSAAVVSAAEKAEIVSVRKIWDEAPHNAFTDLIRHRDRWYCVFREGRGHVSADGALRVLTSTDGEKWESAAKITSATADLRDAKINLLPSGELMLSGAGAMHDRSKKSHQSLAWFSADGQSWSEPVEVGDPDFWLWRTTWHEGAAYGIGYYTTKERTVRLYKSSDGKKYETIVPRLDIAGYPNETSIVFHGKTAYCLLRRDDSPPNGMFGTAQEPFTKWEWRDIGAPIGGPHLMRLPDGRFLAAVRLYNRQVRTALCWINFETARLEEFLPLPSGGDTSYAGMVMHDGLLWVSYYSSHEGKTSIYLAKVKIPAK